MLFPLYLRFGFKAGLACLLAYGLSYLIGSPYAVWAVVSSIVAMQINVADSLHAGALRVSGTALGAAFGVLLLQYMPQTPLLMGTAVTVIVGMCAYFTRYTNLSGPISIGAVVVLLAGSEYIALGNSDAVSFALMRVVEIAIGVGSAFLVSLILWPVRLVDTLRADLGVQFHESARLLDQLLTAFLSGQQNLPYTLLQGIENKIWDNHERLTKARKHESLLYHYEHKVMNIQVTTLDRTAESLRTMLEALNDYDEEGADPLTGLELRTLGDALMATLRHFGGDSPATPAPDLVRGLTKGVAAVENKLAQLRQNGATKTFNLHKILQIFAFYQAMRLLSESLLISLDRLQGEANSRPHKRKQKK